MLRCRHTSLCEGGTRHRYWGAGNYQEVWQCCAGIWRAALSDANCEYFGGGLLMICSFFIVSLFRFTRLGHHLFDSLDWICFKGNSWETLERSGGTHMGLPEHVDTILNWTEQPLFYADFRETRQRNRWVDNIREWTGLEFGKSQRTVKNGGKWRKLVAKSSVVPQRPSR